MYYGDIWKSQSFPFLSQLLFNATASNSTFYAEYNQTLILDSSYRINEDALAAQSLPYLTGTYIVYLITSNMGATAALVHMALWNFDDIKQGWAFMAPENLKKMLRKDYWVFWKGQETPEQLWERSQHDGDLDPHYKLMLKNKYEECPNWWWFTIWLVPFAVGLVCLYEMKVSD